MAELYFRNIHTGKRYKVIRLDRRSGEIVLKGEYAEFTEPYDKERFKRLGYVLEDENGKEIGYGPKQ